MDNTFTQYLETALWCGLDDNDCSLETDYSIHDIAPETLIEMRKEFDDYIEALNDSGLLDEYPHDMEQLAHDFWLTRNGHGAGFWDRGDGGLGERMTEHCKAWGTCELYVGDDNLIYCS